MGKQNNDAENIDENHDAIREVTNGMPFSAKQSEWDKKCKISYEDLRKVAATAKKVRQTANVARAMANRAADEVKFKRRGKER